MNDDIIMHEFLIEKLNKCYSDDQVKNIIDGLKYEKLTTFRVNTLKSDCNFVEKELKENGIIYKKYKSIDNVYILDSNIDTKIKLQNLNIYKNGYIYLQSISSMIPAFVIEPQENENVLDMCAAPGGKTTLMQDISKNKLNLTAIELNKKRYERLKFNIKMQSANVYTLNMNALDLDNNLKFDKVLLDAPCSGTGIININNSAYKKNFTNELISKCVNSQKKLIKKAYNILKKDGILVYSTCSLLNEENEENIDYARKNGFEIAEIDIDKYINGSHKLTDINFIYDKKYLKILPNDLYEGFFVSKLIKK